MAQRQRVFLDVSIGASPAGRLTIELFNDKTPKTCENFRSLCAESQTPLTYKMSRFHRIIDEFMIQGGDITKGDGTGGKSIYGSTFEDENPDWRSMDASGLVCMANRGKDTNSSQFFITLAPCEHLNGKHTIFGHLVSGQTLLVRLAALSVDDDDRPHDDVIISNCGELERRKKLPETLHPTASSSVAETPATSGDERGRKRRHSSRSRQDSRSGSRSRTATKTTRRDTSGSPSISPRPPQKRDRRRSEAQIDETARGRVRKRSPGREQKEPTPAEGDQEQSKRRRHPSPSRDVRDERENSPGFRNRRSLPNHHERRREERGERGEQQDRSSGYRQDGQYDSRDRGGRYDRYGQSSGGSSRGGGGGGGGRLVGGAFDDDDDTGGGEIKLKGRGMMKYRER